ncbi:glycine cleavage system aminomethyltransferase GcvT [Crocinitomix catalasitica]|uniref:glycine cleavage system aminomethyltransferase GcvT n=1 Tax=Crocinitomix catalasitica TaxID=184607 RepID=UPI0004876781|nr:glycine cleavage system aminomethyltransferase GcvT [Crocinitomix catalasitica]
MKDTALSQKHIALGAKMVPFAGYNMPVQYEGVKAEHEIVRTGVGVFDVSHMGEFLLEGENTIALLQKITSNDVSKMVDGQAQYTCLPNATGGVIDDLIIYRKNENSFFVVVNASNIEKDWNWIEKNNDLGVKMQNLSDDYSLLAVQGPKAAEAMNVLTDIDLTDMKYYTFQMAKFAGIDNVMVSATGYTGSGGFELYVKNTDVATLWDKVFEAGESYNIKPIGLAARDTLRLEMGFCLYGNDIDDTTSPLEAGLGWITKFTKDFTNSENLKAQKEAGVKKKLVAFEMVEKGIPRHDYPIVDADGKNIGRVTSGTMSPSLNKAIGLGYVTIENATIDGPIFIEVRNKQIEAKIVKAPFYKA